VLLLQAPLITLATGQADAVETAVPHTGDLALKARAQLLAPTAPEFGLPHSASADTANQRPAPPGVSPAAASENAPLPSGAPSDWSIVDSPNTLSTLYDVLYGVTCVTASDCWAVGYQLTVGPGRYVYQTLIEHWDGASWTIVPSPDSQTWQHNYLIGVTCVTASDCWAVGLFVNPGIASQTLIEHWDGASWTIVPSPTTSLTQDNVLYGVTCASASDCWAAGFYYDENGSVYQTLIEHWDGASWTIVSSPNTSATQDNRLWGVTCASPSDCWAVGFYYDDTLGADQSLIERWDGGSWVIVSSSLPPLASESALLGVTCMSASDCWAVGYYGTGINDQGLLEHWDGTAWTTDSSPPPLAVDSVLLSVTCASASDCWTVGYYYDANSGVFQTLMEHWDGTLWTAVSSPSTSATQNNYPWGVTCAAPSDCLAVGYYHDDSLDVDLSLIERWDGTSWTIVGSPVTHGIQPNFLWDVTCVSVVDCWAVGNYEDENTGIDQTLIERWDGRSWTIVASPNTSPLVQNYLWGVTCVTGSDCWAAGYYLYVDATQNAVYQTLIEHWDGSSWAISPSPNTSAILNNYLYDVTCVTASDCWAVGYYDDGIYYQTLIEHWDGASWTIVSSPNTEHNTLSGVTCVSASDCWAVGYYYDYDADSYQNLIDRWDGISWAIVPSPSTSATQDNRLSSVTCASASECWTIGRYSNGIFDQTQIERWDGASWTIVSSPNTGATDRNYLVDVTCASTECWAVGYGYDGHTFQTLIERWDGASWTIVSSPNWGAQRSYLSGVACVSTHCWAVGYYESDPFAQTLVEHYTTNQAPILAAILDQDGQEDSLLTFTVSASDPDGEVVTISAADLPADASFTDNRDNSATFSWIPAYGTAGTHSFSVMATDSSNTESEPMTARIVVAHTNREPVLAVIPDWGGREGDAIGFTLSASDPDGDAVTYFGYGLPEGATVNSATGAFAWTPSYQQAGQHSLRFLASDGSLNSETRTMMIDVADVQRPPVLARIGNQAGFEGSGLSVSVSASDPEGDAITLLTSALPAGASFVDYGDGTGVFSWTPGAHARGDYAVTFRATDGVAEAAETITIRVAPTNGVPSFTPIGNRAVSEADQINFVVSAIDSNGDTLTYSATNVPRGASFDAARRVFSWVPDYARSGSYVVSFHVTDGSTSVTENATITVTNVNRVPVVSGATSAVIKAHQTLRTSTPFADPDLDVLAYTVQDLPDGAALDATTGVITWRPSPDQVGDHAVAMSASDGSLMASASLTISVQENQAPIVKVIAPAWPEVLQPTSFRANASDPDGEVAPTIVWDFDATDGFQAQRTGADVTWTFEGTGGFTITVRATDGDGMQTTRAFDVSVDDNIALMIEVLQGASDDSGGTPARANVTGWDRTPISGATVTVNVYYEPIAGAGRSFARTFTVTTSEDGSVLFVLPQDTPFADLKGRHVVEASAITQSSLGEDQETGQDADAYVL